MVFTEIQGNAFPEMTFKKKIVPRFAVSKAVFLFYYHTHVKFRIKILYACLNKIIITEVFKLISDSTRLAIDLYRKIFKIKDVVQ